MCEREGGDDAFISGVTQPKDPCDLLPILFSFLLLLHASSSDPPFPNAEEEEYPSLSSSSSSSFPYPGTLSHQVTDKITPPNSWMLRERERERETQPSHVHGGWLDFLSLEVVFFCCCCCCCWKLCRNCFFNFSQPLREREREIGCRSLVISVT